MTSYLQAFLQKTISYPHWKRIGIYPHHGITIMLSSLYSEKSAGIGEYLDLCPLLSWMKQIGMDTLQLLPLTDSAEDPSPYNAVSSSALNPTFLSLWDLPSLQKSAKLGAKLSDLQQLPIGKKIDYSSVRNQKMEFLWEYFQLFFEEISHTEEYRKFMEENSWVYEYSLYLTLRKKFHPDPWIKWPAPFKKPTKQLFPLFKQEEVTIDFYLLLQYLCYQQMEKVKQFAEEQDVFLMGDLPILVSPDSADSWFHQELFTFQYRAGAPPDMYNSQGQNWGFPILLWKEKYAEIQHWWEERLKRASKLYHLYRIDHVVGFFRIWGIGNGALPSEGSFFSENRYLWPFDGKERLTMLLDASLMLPVAEDLGTIPPETYETLKELGICGTKVMRWEKRWEEDGSYIPSSEYEPLSLTTVSTHDSETLWQWWLKFSSEAKEFAASRGWQYKSNLDSSLRYALLEDAHSSSSLFHCNLLQEYLALFPELSHEDPNIDRINLPGTPSEKNWSFSFRTNVETIISHDKLENTMQDFSSSLLIDRNPFTVKE